MWLFFPLTALIHRAAFDERAKVRLGTWLALAAAVLLILLSLPVFPLVLQAWGNNLAATAVIAGALAWHISHPPAAAGSGGALKPPIS
jgi:alpha-1,2-mannosyltransferase